jgi:hypothetical protein
MSAATAFNALSVRAASTTVAPSRANRRAAAAPMPRLAPVTSATLPDSIPVSVVPPPAMVPGPISYEHPVTKYIALQGVTASDPLESRFGQRHLSHRITARAVDLNFWVSTAGGAPEHP